jgi:serine/threonine-protein kinase
MGEVYRARDTRLKRDVAIKVLPEAFAHDPGRMARFQREAEVLAILNHPNIAHIYGVEERAPVMELVEGESPKGPMPFDEAWKIATQIADALEYAHEKGVIHRDLKPSNVKVTSEGVVKLLDFGLAKAFSQPPDFGSTSPENSPAVTLTDSVGATIMGTAAYMAPEQAQGKNVDKRADIWSWGVVLYELLTGERMFKGNDVADTLAQVLTKTPDLDRIPVKVRRLLGDCLQKDPKHRLRDIGDARRLLTEAENTFRPARRWSLGWIAAVVIAVVLGAALWRTKHLGDSPFKPLVRLDVDLGTNISPGSPPGPEVTISPDGTRLVYVSQNRLLTRRLDQSKAGELPGTEGAFAPFFFA